MRIEAGCKTVAGKSPINNGKTVGNHRNIWERYGKIWERYGKIWERYWKIHYKWRCLAGKITHACFF